MTNSIYATVARQQGLIKEMEIVSNNLANISTTGYKSNNAIFAEFLVSAGSQNPSLSMGSLTGQSFNLEQGALSFTGGQLDLAIQGDGFFAVDTLDGPRLTRAGNFNVNADGVLMDPFGNPVLAMGQNPINIPTEATEISIGADGSISVDGQLLNQVGVFLPSGSLQRESSSMFEAPDGFTEIEDPNVVQGALEKSNVSAVLEVSRMIQVQRAYEAGQALLEREDARIGKVIDSVRQG